MLLRIRPWGARWVAWAGCWVGAAAVGSCAHGVDTPLGENLAGLDGGNPTGTAGSGGSDTSGSAGAGTSGAAGASAGSGGASGAASAAGGGGASGSAGNGGAAGTDGASGAGGASGEGGSAGSGGASGSAGAGGTTGNGGTAGAAGASGAGGSGGAAGTIDAGPTPGPTGVTVGTQRTDTALQAPSGSGTAFRDNCPADQALIGYTGTTEPAGSATNYLRSFQPVCGRFAITGDGPFTVTTAMAGTLPTRGTPFSATQTRMCPANQIVVGFSGRQGGLIDSLVFNCAPLVISGTAPNYTMTIGTAAPIPLLGGPGGTSTFPAHNCPSGQIAVTTHGRAQGSIDAFGLACAAPTLVVR